MNKEQKQKQKQNKTKQKKKEKKKEERKQTNFQQINWKNKEIKKNFNSNLMSLS